MQTIWKGAVSFGLVNVPVKIFTATQENDIAMKMLHKEFHVLIHYARTGPKCDGEVKWSEIVKGYEYEPGHFVTFEKEEKKTNVVDLMEALRASLQQRDSAGAETAGGAKKRKTAAGAKPAAGGKKDNADKETGAAKRTKRAKSSGSKRTGS